MKSENAKGSFMKNLNLKNNWSKLGAAFLLSLSFISMSANAQLTGSKDVQIGVNDVYVPSGFDSSTDAYVVVSGILMNGCYKWKEASVKNIDAFNHEITTMATVSPGMCLMVLIPFQKEVKIGKLASGAHNLKFMSGDGTYLEKKLTVE